LLNIERDRKGTRKKGDKCAQGVMELKRGVKALRYEKFPLNFKEPFH
jgi:hypothetical protein